MKILISLAFLVCGFIYFVASDRLMKMVVSSIRNRHVNFLVVSLLGLLIMFLMFMAYWLLTGIFATDSMLLLLSASVLAQIIYAVTGSALGLTIEDNRNKIGVLAMVRGFELGMRYPWVNTLNKILGWLMLINWVVPLAIYLIVPGMTPRALFWISFCLFIVPQAIGTIIVNEFTIPSLVAAENDNDLRNHYFIYGFNNVLSTTVFIMLPLGLFYNFYHDPSSLPPYWILLLTPLLLFILLTIIPFLAGSGKYHHQQLFNLDWRLEWLNAVSHALIMPDEASRNNALQEKLAELDATLAEHLGDHDVLKFIDDIDSEEVRAAAEKDANVKAIAEIFKANKANIHRWDIRAGHLKKLKELKDNIRPDNIGNCTAYIDTILADTVKEREKQSQTKSRIAGLIITAATTAIGFLFKHYQDDILRILGNLN